MSSHLPSSNVSLARCWPWLIILAAIWVPVVYLLGAQWSLFAEYQYGWCVPFLCLYLAWQRLATRPPVAIPARKNTAILWLVTAGLGFWVMRLLQEANPLWRAASYGLVCTAVLITLSTIYLAQGRARAVHFIFPAAFFLVAVPWPTFVEQLIIQRLTGLNASLVVEAMNLAGVPALRHGNVIEISTGMVGIDEACSGIRSFQATFMMALFFGEFYLVQGARRWWLLAAGPVLALIFNLLRTVVLVSIAANAGLPVMEKWHDTTGEVLLVGCFISLWVLALFMKGRPRPQMPMDGQKTSFPTPVPRLRPLMTALVIWAVVLQVSTETWFRSHEARGSRVFTWAAQWPSENPTIHTNIIPPVSLQILQCDENASASWTSDGGIFWRAFYLRWLPADSFYGRAKEATSKSHNPARCLPASGMELRERLAPVSLPVSPGFNLTFDRFVFSDQGRDLYVFFSQTEDMMDERLANSRKTPLSRLRAAIAGSRNYGQNNFEIAMMGPNSPAAALEIFSARLPRLVKTQVTPP